MSQNQRIIKTPMFLEDLIKNAKQIMDVGTGPMGSFWYKYVNDDAEVVGINRFFIPKTRTKHYLLAKIDALVLEDIDEIDVIKVDDNTGNEINGKLKFCENFDLVVADHVFEHVENPAKLARGVYKSLKKGGMIHIGIPHADNFTDRFYHLIHPEGGGHISSLTKESMIKIMEDAGFKLIKYADWPDDWGWLERLYDWKGRGVKYFSQDDIDYIVKVFRKELTPEKGYLYGGEYVFQKI